MESNKAPLDILIIEDSLATILFLKDILAKLGFPTIHYAQSASDGILLFKELAQNGKSPIVFLDYELQDSNGLAVITKVLEQKPNTKVIIQSARGREEASIKELLSIGAYEFIEKPIHLNKVKEILELLQHESTPSDDVNVNEILEHVINTSSRLSFAKIQEINQLDPGLLSSAIENFCSKKILIQLPNSKDIACNVCNSVLITLLFYCPSCKGSNFKRTNLLEHYDCGYSGLESEFIDNKCPKCNKKLKARGVDHQQLSNYYICSDCNDKFPEPFEEYLCQKCGNKFAIDDAKWITSPSYKVVKNA